MNENESALFLRSFFVLLLVHSLRSPFFLVRKQIYILQRQLKSEAQSTTKVTL